jgi:Ca-activated chloride channel family protein
MSEHEKYEILISAYLDGETTPEEEALLQQHIKECASCQAFLGSTQKLSSLMKAWNDEKLSPDSEQEIRKKYHNQEDDKMKAPLINSKVLVTLAMVIVVAVVVKTQMPSLMRVRDKADEPKEQVVSRQTPATPRQTRTDARKTPLAKDEAASPSITTKLAQVTREITGAISKTKVSGGEAKLARARRQTAMTDMSLAAKGVKLQEEMSAGIMPIDRERIMPGAQPDFNTEQYDRIYENQFLKVMDNPLSTFSIDVDTASYSNLRRFLNQNQMPPEDAVRIEEMINYFSYDYPQPQGKHPFSVTTKAAPCPWNKDHDVALIGLQGKTLQADEIPPSNLVFLLDVSGSMNQPNKLPLLKSAFNLLVKQLGADDRVAMVVYAGAAGVVLESTPGNQNMTILNALNDLKAGGSTAGGAGIKLAYEIAVKNYIPDGNNRVILATDGDFNIGVSSDGALTRLIEEKRKQGVFLTVLGFGMGNYKDSRMEKLADKGNGNYYYIDTIKEAKKVLVSELGSTLFTIAKDVKIQIEFNPATVKAYRLIGYENRILAKEDFNDDTKDAGELGAGHTVTAIYEIVPVGSKETFGDVDDLVYQESQIKQSDDLMTVKFRYKEPEADTSQLIKKPLTRQQMSQSVSGDFQFAVAVAEFGLLLRNSQYKGTASYDHVLQSARASKGSDTYGYRAEMLDLVEKAQALDMRSSVGSGQIQFKGQR